MPFIYTHLVSLACFAYLITEAFLTGVRFTPSASLGFSLVLPFTSLIAKIISTFGTRAHTRRVCPPAAALESDTAASLAGAHGTPSRHPTRHDPAPSSHPTRHAPHPSSQG